MKKFLSIILAGVMLLTLVPGSAFAYSDAYGSEVWQENTAVHYGVTLSDNIYWSHYYEQLRHEYFVTVEPGNAVTPVVAYGDAVCSRLSASEAAASSLSSSWRLLLD